MKRIVIIAAVLLGLSLNVAAQSQQQQAPPTPPQQAAAAPQEKTPPEVILTGCLVQGSGPAVFIFENAKLDPKNAEEKPSKFLVVVAAEDLSLRTHLNHQVRITGATDGKPQPQAGQKVEEKDLPKFSARTVTMVADTCAVPVTR